MRRRYTGLSRRLRTQSSSRPSRNGDRDTPLVSILIRTRNRPNLLVEAVESVVNQDYRPLEVVVVNDGGDDPSFLLNKLDLKGVSLRLVNLSGRQGRAVAANEAFRNSKGRYVNFLDDDDVLLPHHVSTLVRVLEAQHRRVAYTACDMVEVELLPNGQYADTGKIIKRFSSPFDEERILFENFIPFMALMMEREAFIWAGGIDPGFEIYEDWDLIIRLSDRFTPLHVPEMTALYRVHVEGGVGVGRTPQDVWKWTERIFEKHKERITPDKLSGYLKRVIGARISELEDKGRRVEALEKEIEALKKENERIDALRLEVEKERDALQTKVDILEAKIDVLQAERDTLLRYKAAVETTLGWKILVKIRGVRDTLLPEGSLRRTLLWSSWTGFLKERNRVDKLKRGIALLKNSGLRGSWEYLKAKARSEDSYKTWVVIHTPTERRLREMKREAESWKGAPLISVIMPVYKTPMPLLQKAIDSVIAQAYPNWELCIADDGSGDPGIEGFLKEVSQRDPRIKARFLDENGGISRASNAALELAEGEFVALLDHDDELAPHALYEVARVILANPQVDMIYSDEDKLDPSGNRCEPFFKPDWSPDLLLTQMYTCHLGVYRRSIVEEIGGFRGEYDGSQDYDLVLRFTERTDKVHHIPDVLYHWRMVPGSCAGEITAKPFAQDAGRRALEDALRRRGIRGSVLPGYSTGMYRVRYEILEPHPKVSIIIPNRDKVTVLNKCISSILQKTAYTNYEVVIVENGSREAATFSYYEEITKEERVSLLKYTEQREFNFAAINNWAVERTEGDMVLFLNNDTEVISHEWLGAMVEHAQRKEVGAVGAKLLFSDDAIQHAGVILGIMGVANHEHMGLKEGMPGYFGRPNAIHNVSAVTAACMLTRREVFQEVGGFDEQNLPVAFNDVDFCLRLREKGYWIVYTPYSVLYHYESSSRGKEDIFRERFQRETNYMLSRWGDVLENDPFYNPNLTREDTNFAVRV